MQCVLFLIVFIVVNIVLLQFILLRVAPLRRIYVGVFQIKQTNKQTNKQTSNQTINQ